MTNHYLQVNDLTVTLGNFSLKNIRLACGKGEYHVLLGPTGSGKSTLIKCILGFFHLGRNTIWLNGRDISRFRPEERRMGYVPQNYSLFPHLKVEENIRFGLCRKKNNAAAADQVVDRMCDLLGIQALRHRSIRNLSGGERQKVALARALATQPEVIVLDEPFSSIDEGGRRDLWVEMKKVINEIGITALHITHNLEEAYSMGERLSVMLDGTIHQSDAKREVFDHPATRQVAGFLNYRNLFSGTARSHAAGTEVDTGGFRVVLEKKIPAGTAVDLCVRQQDIKIIKKGEPFKEALKHNIFEGHIVSVFPFPEYCLLYFRMINSPREFDFEIKLPPYLKDRYDLFPGKEVQVGLWEPNIIVF